jgi:hypothetical protein
MPEQRHEDFETVERRLREARPQASEAALTRARLAAAAAETPAPRRRHSFGLGRSRVAIAALLASGVLMSGGGAALAISGVNSSGSAGAAQYEQPTGGNTVLGEPPTTPGDDTPGDGTDPGTGSGNENVGEVVQPGRQVTAASGEKQLPFTGLAALPIIMAGVVLLTAGAVMRTRAAKPTV